MEPAVEAASHQLIAILFDIDGTLVTSGGAGAASWRLAFDELYGIPADIGRFTDQGMTDPEVGRRTFEAVVHPEPPRGRVAEAPQRGAAHPPPAPAPPAPPPRPPPGRT